MSSATLQNRFSKNEVRKNCQDWRFLLQNASLTQHIIIIYYMPCRTLGINACERKSKRLFSTQMSITQIAQLCVGCPVMINDTEKFMPPYRGGNRNDPIKEGFPQDL